MGFVIKVFCRFALTIFTLYFLNEYIVRVPTRIMIKYDFNTTCLAQFRMTVKILADKILPLFYQTGIAPFLSGQYNRYML